MTQVRICSKALPECDAVHTGRVDRIGESRRRSLRSGCPRPSSGRLSGLQRVPGGSGPKLPAPDAVGIGGRPPNGRITGESAIAPRQR
jgi:hypothetical protein